MDAYHVWAIVRSSSRVGDLYPLGFISVLVARLPEGLSAAVGKRSGHTLSRRHGDVAPTRHVRTTPNKAFLFATEQKFSYTDKQKVTLLKMCTHILIFSLKPLVTMLRYFTLLSDIMLLTL